MSEVIELYSTPTATKLLPFSDEIIDRLIEGETLYSIADNYNVSLSAFRKFLEKHLPARVSIAYKLSSYSFMELARKELSNARTFEEIARARELASHYRHEAKIRNREVFGDKVEIEDKRPQFTPDQFAQLLEVAQRNAPILNAESPDNAGLIGSGERTEL